MLSLDDHRRSRSYHFDKLNHVNLSVSNQWEESNMDNFGMLRFYNLDKLVGSNVLTLPHMAYRILWLLRRPPLRYHPWPNRGDKTGRNIHTQTHSDLKTLTTTVLRAAMVKIAKIWHNFFLLREGVKNILRGGSLDFRGGTDHIPYF